jgi:hypothetical protein
MAMYLSAQSSRRFRLAVGLAVVLLITAGWLCLIESHEEHDHALPHDLCAGMVIIAATMVTAVMFAPAGAMIPGLVLRRPTRAVPVLDPPPRSSDTR